MPGSGRRLEERSFHRWVARTLTGGSRGLLPLGDDTAALPLGGGRVALLTTDALVEWTHFLPNSPPEAIGAAAANASLSDLAAKGGRPVALTLDLLLPAETPEGWARAVVRAADRAVRRFGGAVVGGDTKPSETPTVVGTLFGLGRADRLAPRTGGRPGDLLVTTGHVGRGGRAYRRFTERGPEDRAALRELLAIEPRIREGAALVPVAHAMLDTSDGIAEATRLLAEASGLRATLLATALPLAPGLTRGPDGSLPSAAFFGGDYELLAAIPPGRYDAARTAVLRRGGRLSAIGRLAPGRGAWLEDRSGVARPMPPMGFLPGGTPPGADRRVSASHTR